MTARRRMNTPRRKAAFEAAIAAASLALRQGHEVTVTAPSSETTTGAQAK